MQTCVFSFSAPPLNFKTHSQPNTPFLTNRPSLISTQTLSRKLICKPPAGKYVSDNYLVQVLVKGDRNVPMILDGSRTRNGVKSLPVGAYHAKMSFQNHNNHDTYRFSKLHLNTSLFSRTIPKTTHILSSRRNYELDYDDGAHKEPFWLTFIRESIWAVRSLFVFLVEQPSQLKYIEWPSFQSTLKTAMLTLVLVAVLIVALSSVDSALSFLLALLSRRKA